MKTDKNIPDDDLTQPDTSCDLDPLEHMGDGEMCGESHLDKVEMLLTAPTGKAANLLGKRANEKAYTLHQVIYSYRLLKEGKILVLS